MLGGKRKNASSEFGHRDKILFRNGIEKVVKSYRFIVKRNPCASNDNIMNVLVIHEQKGIEKPKISTSNRKSNRKGKLI
jgi:hypothetical protein